MDAKGSLILILITQFIFGISACEKERYFNCGLKSPIYNDSYGQVEAHVDRNVEKLYLKGQINLREGRVEINIINAENCIIYSEIIIAPNDLHINETFKANSGNWKLKYTSRNGIGDIHLRLHQ